MRIVIQRVSSVSLTADGVPYDQMGEGILAMVGIESGDNSEKVMNYMLDKLVHMRIFEDENGKMNLAPDKIGAELLIISQFTLFADCRSRRPGFSLAARPETAIPLYETVIRLCSECGFHVETGVFAAEMMVDSENDGPVTILLDTDEL